MKLELRKFVKFVDKTFIEGGKEAKEPVLLVSVAAVIKNPWHGKGFVEDLKPIIIELSTWVYMDSYQKHFNIKLII